MEYLRCATKVWESDKMLNWCNCVLCQAITSLPSFVPFVRNVAARLYFKSVNHLNFTFSEEFSHTNIEVQKKWNWLLSWEIEMEYHLCMLQFNSSVQYTVYYYRGEIVCVLFWRNTFWEIICNTTFGKHLYSLSYLIFVIFFTLAYFRAWKFYTQKCVNSRQNLPRDKTA